MVADDILKDPRVSRPSVQSGAIQHSVRLSPWFVAGRRPGGKIENAGAGP